MNAWSITIKARPEHFWKVTEPQFIHSNRLNLTGSNREWFLPDWTSSWSAVSSRVFVRSISTICNDPLGLWTNHGSKRTSRPLRQCCKFRWWPDRWAKRCRLPTKNENDKTKLTSAHFRIGNPPGWVGLKNTLNMGEIRHMSMTFEPRNWPRQAWKQRSGMPKRKDKSMNWTMKLPPYSMLNRAKRDTLKSPNVAANRANMGDMLCGQMPPSFRRDSSSGSTFPSAFRFLLRFFFCFVLQKKKIVKFA